MKVLIDLTNLREQPTGIENVAYYASQELIKQNPNFEFVLLFWNYVPLVYFKFALEGYNITTVQLKVDNFASLRHKHLPNEVIKQKADLNLYFAFPSPVECATLNAVSVIHDLSPFRKEQFMDKDAYDTWKPLITNAIAHNRHIITVSNTVKKEIEENFKISNCTCIYPGITVSEGSDTSILDDLGLKPKEYLLSVSSLDPRKNAKELIRAYSKLIVENKLKDKLVFSFYKTKELETFLKNFPQKVIDNIVFANYVSGNKLNALYQNTSLFILTSIYEGFGLPVMEAARNNAPILTSDIDVFREITGNLANYYHLGNVNDLCKKIISTRNDIRNSDKLYELSKSYT